MDGAINAAATANNYVLAYGDFRAAFVIVDRIGTQIELIPNLVGSEPPADRPARRVPVVPHGVRRRGPAGPPDAGRPDHGVT